MSVTRMLVATSVFLACAAPVEQPSEGPIERLAAELRQGNPWPDIREERIRTLLPAAMDAAGVDAWVVFCRENANDPLAIHVGGESAGGDAAYLFFRTAEGVDRIIIAPSSEVITIRERSPNSRVEARERDQDVYAAVATELRAAGVALHRGQPERPGGRGRAHGHTGCQAQSRARGHTCEPTDIVTRARHPVAERKDPGGGRDHSESRRDHGFDRA